jgi:hypothetical protein
MPEGPFVYIEAPVTETPSTAPTTGPIIVVDGPDAIAPNDTNSILPEEEGPFVYIGAPNVTDTPTTAPTTDPIVVVDPEPTCSCGPGMVEGSFKCGTTVYYCPNLNQICSVQPSANSDLVILTQAMCDTYKTLNIGDVCPGDGRALSNMVCYDTDMNGVKNDGTECGVCSGTVPVPEPPQPLPAPETDANCPMDYLNENTGASTCGTSGPSIVTLNAIKGYDNGKDYSTGQGMIYGIELDVSGDTVTFKVNNVFGEASDIYVQHEVFAVDAAGNAIQFLNAECEAVKTQAPCLATTDPSVYNTFTAACHPQGYAIVYVFFATTDSNVASYGGGAATVPKCCYPDEYAPDTGIVEFAYKIECSCPSSSSQRTLLRGGYR